MARSSPTASTCCPSSTSSGRSKFGFRVSAAAWYDAAYAQPRQHQHRDAPTRWSTACRSPARCRPYTKRYAKGASGEWLDAFVFANFDVADVPVNVKAGQHTVYWGDSLLLGGAVHGVSYAQNSLDIWKGFCDAGHRSEGAVPSARRHHAAGAADQGPVDRRPVVLQLAGGAHPGVGQLPDDPGRDCKFGGDSLIFGAESARRADPRRAGVSAPVEREQDVTPSRYSASLGDWGISARWSPEWLDGTMGFYYRNTTDIAAAG